MVIYRAEVITNLNEMLDYWNDLAVAEGLNGLTYAYQDMTFDMISDKDDSRFDYNIEFQPSYAWVDMHSKSKLKSSKMWSHLRSAKRKMYTFFEKKKGFDLERYFRNNKNNSQVEIAEFDDVWNAVLARMPDSEKNIPEETA